MPLVTLHSAVDRVIEDTTARQAKGGSALIGLPSGFAKVDEVLGGFREDALYVLGGGTGMGKSSLALSWAINVAKDSRRVLFISLEMSASLLALRLISGQTGISARDLEYGRLTTDELSYVNRTKEQYKDLHFDLYDDSMNSDSLLENMKKYKDAKGLDFLVVDYAALLRDQTSFGETDRIGRIVANTREVARVCNIPVLALAQLNRESQKRESHLPSLSDYRSSAAYEQDAFVAMAVHRPHYYSMMMDGEAPVDIEHDAQIIIMKNRMGSTGSIAVQFHPTKMLWTDTTAVPTDPPKTNNGSLVAKVQEGAKRGK